MRIAICDDDVNQLELIKSAVLDHAKLNGEEYYINCFDNSILFLEHLEKSRSYDLLFLDIFMPGVLGIDVAKEIRKMKYDMEIIFLTTSSDYAVEAFSLRAAHYIIKPFMLEQVFDALERVISKLNNMKAKTIEFRLRNGELRIVDPNEIMYVESQKHSQNIYFLNGGCIEARQTMAEIFSILKGSQNQQFISPYKGFIVNQKSIRGIEKDKIILKSGRQIPIVKRKFSEIKEKYFGYIFNIDSE